MKEEEPGLGRAGCEITGIDDRENRGEKGQRIRKIKERGARLEGGEVDDRQLGNGMG